MECTALVVLAKASFSGGGNCVEVGFHDSHVHIRNSRFPDREVHMSLASWRRLTSEAAYDLTTWFPSETYGDFSASFNDEEAVAFFAGMAAREPQLVGPVA